MDDVELAILNAWHALAPALARDPEELRRRLARRDRSKLLSAAPRAWCLALRANDTRLEHFAFSPPRLLTASTSEPQEITLTRDNIVHLCAPVRLTAPGQTLDEVAALLGTTRQGLLGARVAGVFKTHYVRGLGGRGGKPRPLLYTDQFLDPASRNFASPDDLWSWTASFLAHRLPDDLEPQTLRRVPHHRGRVADWVYEGRDPRDFHPEDPRVDPPSPRPRKSLALPPPPPDYVWYKWKDGEHVGHDWRNPLASANHFRREDRLERSRQTRARRRREYPSPPLAADSYIFQGLRWLCPRCNKPVNVLFLPVRPINLLSSDLRSLDPNPETRNPNPETRNPNDESAIPHPSSFACGVCHRVRRFSRCDPNLWNEIVTYLSGGLLFGREVKRPDWFPNRKSQFANRKLPYTPRPTRAPSMRRPQIESMLLSGMSFKDIAAKLHLVKGTVLWYAQQIYKHHGVRTLPQLLTKLGHPELIEDSRYKTEEIRARLRAGQSTRQIATELHVPMYSVYNQRVKLLKEGVRLRDGRRGSQQAAAAQRR